MATYASHLEPMNPGPSKTCCHVQPHKSQPATSSMDGCPSRPNHIKPGPATSTNGMSKCLDKSKRVQPHQALATFVSHIQLGPETVQAGPAAPRHIKPGPETSSNDMTTCPARSSHIKPGPKTSRNDMANCPGRSSHIKLGPMMPSNGMDNYPDRSSQVQPHTCNFHYDMSKCLAKSRQVQAHQAWPHFSVTSSLFPKQPTMTWLTVHAGPATSSLGL